MSRFRRVGPRLALLALVAAPAVLATRPAAAPSSGAASAADGWRAEFEAICAKTQDAMVLSDDELRRLVQRADALMPSLERLPETERKVFTKRLVACRNLYSYVLESREKR